MKKTSIEISEDLLNEARKVAERERITLRTLIESGLRQALNAREARAAFRLRLVTFRGDGLHPQAGEGAWERIRDFIYEGRGA